MLDAIGLALRSKRLALGLERSEFAEALGVTAGWIKHIEIGIKPPGEDFVERVDAFYDAVSKVASTMQMSDWSADFKKGKMTPTNKAVLSLFVSRLPLSETINHIEGA